MFLFGSRYRMQKRKKIKQIEDDNGNKKVYYY